MDSKQATEWGKNCDELLLNGWVSSVVNNFNSLKQFAHAHILKLWAAAAAKERIEREPENKIKRWNKKNQLARISSRSAAVVSKRENFIVGKYRDGAMILWTFSLLRFFVFSLSFLSLETVNIRTDIHKH